MIITLCTQLAIIRCYAVTENAVNELLNDIRMGEKNFFIFKQVQLL